MAAYTELSPSFISYVESNFNIGTVYQFKPIVQGVSNSNYFLYTEAGTFVLTIVEQESANLPKQLSFLEHVNSDNVPVPIKSTTGQLFGYFNGKSIVVTPKFKGTTSFDVTPSIAFQVGAHLAELHHKSQKFNTCIQDPRCILWISDSINTLSQMPAASGCPKVVTLKSAFEILTNSNYLRDPSLPFGIIHADLFKDNVLVESEKIIAILDFHFSCSGIFVYDLAIVLNDWGRHSSGNINPPAFNSIIEGYSSIRPLEPIEQLYFDDAIMHAAIRFQTSRLLDAYAPKFKGTPVKDLDYFHSILKESIG